MPQQLIAGTTPAISPARSKQVWSQNSTTRSSLCALLMLPAPSRLRDDEPADQAGLAQLAPWTKDSLGRKRDQSDDTSRLGAESRRAEIAIAARVGRACVGARDRRTLNGFELRSLNVASSLISRPSSSSSGRMRASTSPNARRSGAKTIGLDDSRVRLAPQSPECGGDPKRGRLSVGLLGGPPGGHHATIFISRQFAERSLA